MAEPRITVGNVEIVALLDVPFALPPDRMFPTVPTEAWEPYKLQYPYGFLDNGMIRTNATSYLVRSQGRTILVDTGLGPGPHQMAGGASGNLLNDLQSHSVQRGDIDLVIITHLHGDHIGSNATVSGETVRRTFPRARYLIPERDWEHFRQPQVLASSPAIQPHVIALHAQGVVELVSGERVVTSELTITPTPGHTPGHQSILVMSQGQRAAIIGDVAHTPVQAEQADWSPGFDFDPDQSRETRHRLFDRIEQEGAVMCACHFPHPGFGRLVRQQGKRMFQAL